ncbi:amidohydrolase family protein [Dysgonomonas sp. GY617]|uniref:amidohydrolase family protein n=1 Tax=Dysgonomonas sp. GY617 TaxID=2780420 RepID=UPI001883B787|nr:amidohydrolase family protein [Dysgonomonas sp. GY617]MBF0575272.1 amidohydrolase [Dysgonomonas sp. GY617]
MKNIKIIDAHAHLWLKQDTEVNGLKIQTLDNGRSLFMGEVRQMLPPFMVDGRNTAEIFLSNMDYAQVSAAVITQEYIDGLQNGYLWEVQQKYPNRFLCCGMVDARSSGYFEHVQKLIEQGFKAIKIPAERLIEPHKQTFLTSSEMMKMFKLMEEKDILLSIDLAEGDTQIAEMGEVISEYPDLRIAIGHFGMVNRPNWQKQIKLARYKNVMIESGGITWLFNDEFYPFKGAVLAIKEAASLVGMEKLMWGSDYPRTITAITYRMSYDFILKSDLLPENEKRMFLGENAVRFYNLKDLVELPYIKNMSE